ncbi:hypothetical protein [Erwinia piriflorinigrans]|nr:hypothetical protein [Erwinia piriflorinigrans]
MGRLAVRGLLNHLHATKMVGRAMSELAIAILSLVLAVLEQINGFL